MSRRRRTRRVDGEELARRVDNVCHLRRLSGGELRLFSFLFLLMRPIWHLVDPMSGRVILSTSCATCGLTDKIGMAAGNIQRLLNNPYLE